jgi:hypothetical protein
LRLTAACSSSPAGPTSSTSSSTTTIVDDTCDRVASDSVGFIEDLLAELDETRLIEFRERGAWNDDLVRLERRGADLDIRAAALGCDPESVRRTVLEQSDFATSGPLAAGLVEFLLVPPTTTTTTAAPTPTTNSG